MKELVFDTGVVSFSLNGACTVSFNPTDSEFVKRLFDSFDALDKKQDAYKAEIEKMADKKQIFEIARRLDAEMREINEDMFEKQVWDALFRIMNVYGIGI